MSGQNYRVILNTDLTKYGVDLVVGAKGWSDMDTLNHNRMCQYGGVWVRFDCGRSLEVLHIDTSLIVLDVAYHVQQDIWREQARQRDEQYDLSLKASTNIVVHLRHTGALDQITYVGPQFNGGSSWGDHSHGSQSCKDHEGRKLREFFTKHNMPMEVVKEEKPVKAKKKTVSFF